MNPSNPQGAVRPAGPFAVVALDDGAGADAIARHGAGDVAADAATAADDGKDTVAATVVSSPLYRRIWRWHFYAGLICLPFVLLLATTGALYLFRFEIENLVYRDVLVVAPQTASLDAQRIVDAAARAQPGRVIRYTPAPAADRSAEVDLRDADGVVTEVFVNPGNGAVLGTVAGARRLMPFVRQIHSLALFGTVANHVIEIVAGWVIVLIVTGVWLWWPRGRRGGVLSLRRTPARRIWWRDLHAVSGVLAGGIVLFLALTGMPWSAFWGQQFNSAITARGWGIPAAAWNAVPQSHAGHHESTADRGELPWSFREVGVPVSTPAMAHHGGAATAHAAAPIGVDAAVIALARLGMPGGYQLSLPEGPGGVYSAVRLPDKAIDQRVIHLDQYTGRPLADIGYAQYGPVSQLTEWGVSIHMGREFGRANQIVMLTGCIALIVMATSAAVMWWKRRPVGALGAPPRPDAKRVARGAVAIAVVLGLLFPLLGASMLAAAALDWLVPRVWKARWAL